MNDDRPPLMPKLDTFVEEHTKAGARRVLSCRTVAAGHFRQMNYIRNLPPYTIEQTTGEQTTGEQTTGDQTTGDQTTGERRTGLAGNEAMPTPAEALLAALGSCIAVGIQANAIARAIPVRSLDLDVEAEFDPTAAWGVVNARPEQIGFNTIRITAHIEADAPREVLQALLSHVVLWSPLSNTLYNPVQIDAALA